MAYHGTYKEYPLELKPMNRADAEFVSNAIFNRQGGLGTALHLADGYRDCDYRYTLTLLSPKTLAKSRIARIEAFAEGIQYARR